MIHTTTTRHARQLTLAALLAFGTGPSVMAGTTWDGGGSDSNINTQNNWDDNFNPDLTGGSSTLTFGTGGSLATINTAVNIAGLVFNRDANFEIGNGTGNLTIGSGGISMTLPTTTGRTHTISESNLILGASQNWSVTNNTGTAQLNVSSNIDDGASTFAITKLGDGLLSLSGNNSFGNSGSNGLILGTNLGSSPYTNTGGIIRLASGTAAGVGRIAVFGGYQMGRLELSGNINVGNRIELYGRQGPNHVAISNFSGDNTLSGEWNITANGSSLNIGSDSGKLTITGATPTGSAGRVLTFLGNGEIDFGKVVNGTVFSQVRTFGGGLYHLTQNNAYTGVTTVNANGKLRISHANALGTIDTGTTVISGGALQIDGGITTAAEALSLSGTGVGNTGALRNISSDNIYRGAITLDSTARINSDLGILTLDVASGNAIASADIGLTFGGAGNIVVNDAIALGSGGITKDGVGILTLSGSNTYTGATTVNGGKLIIGTGGSLSNTLVTVGGASATGTPVLGGIGLIGGNTLISSASGGVAGRHAPGLSSVAAGVGTQAFSGDLTYGNGSIFEWDINANSTTSGFDKVTVAGSIHVGTGTTFAINLGSAIFTGGDFVDAGFWKTAGSPQTWSMSGIFSKSLSSGQFLSVSTVQDVSAFGTFSITGTTLTWTAVPEPTSAMAGILLGAGLLRRRRVVG